MFWKDGSGGRESEWSPCKPPKTSKDGSRMAHLEQVGKQRWSIKGATEDAKRYGGANHVRYYDPSSPYSPTLDFTV